MDIFITNWLYSFIPHGIFFDQFFLFFSAVGNYSLVWIGIGFLIVLFEEVRHHEFMVVFFGGLLLVWLMVAGIKQVVKRPRPIATMQDFSFPSGHAATSFYAATILSWYVSRNTKYEIRISKQKRKKNIKVAFYAHQSYLMSIILYVIAGIIAFSRIYLGVHYFFDVVAGILLGLIVARSFIHLNTWHLRGT